MSATRTLTVTELPETAHHRSNNGASGQSDRQRTEVWQSFQGSIDRITGFAAPTNTVGRHPKSTDEEAYLVQATNMLLGEIGAIKPQVTNPSNPAVYVLRALTGPS